MPGSKETRKEVFFGVVKIFIVATAIAAALMTVAYFLLNYLTGQ